MQTRSRSTTAAEVRELGNGIVSDLRTIRNLTSSLSSSVQLRAGISNHFPLLLLRKSVQNAQFHLWGASAALGRVHCDVALTHVAERVGSCAPCRTPPRYPGSAVGSR